MLFIILRLQNTESKVPFFVRLKINTNEFMRNGITGFRDYSILANPGDQIIVSPLYISIMIKYAIDLRNVGPCDSKMLTVWHAVFASYVIEIM